MDLMYAYIRSSRMILIYDSLYTFVLCLVVVSLGRVANTRPVLHLQLVSVLIVSKHLVFTTLFTDLHFAFIFCILNVFFSFSLSNCHQCRHFVIVAFLSPCLLAFSRTLAMVCLLFFKQ